MNLALSVFPLPEQFYQNYHASDASALQQLIDHVQLSPEQRQQIRQNAHQLVLTIRAHAEKSAWLEAFLHEYQLSTQEGTALMCLAEAILRIPDKETVDRLIADKITTANWQRHLDGSSLFVNAGTWGLLLTGKLLKQDDSSNLRAALQSVLAKGGEPIVRSAIGAAVRLLGRKFIIGRSIEHALSKSRSTEQHGYRFSYDMLGEGARTMHDAKKYFAAYANAIAAVGQANAGRGPIDGPGISVKLSALHPRYEWTQRERCITELLPKLIELTTLASQSNINFTIDAEEADRLELSLEIFTLLCRETKLAHWQGLGLAVQAYQKRALPTLQWLIDLARQTRHKFMVRLVKGAYWDSEIKRGQERGLPDYPVFTRKAATDVSYLACAKEMLAASDVLYSQFATHNGYTAAALLTLAQDTPFELQRLFGMGEALHEQIMLNTQRRITSRIYAPVGGYQDLLPYLVRRLLENGANTSFVNQISDEQIAIDDLLADPIEIMEQAQPKAHPRIVLPAQMYGEARKNSPSYDVSNRVDLKAIEEGLRAAEQIRWQAGPIINGKLNEAALDSITNPADLRQQVGTVGNATADHVESALKSAADAAPQWNATNVEQRARCLERAADMMAARMPALMGLVIREAGKTIPDAIAELREAIDFCRYYAAQAREKFTQPLTLPGPTGERNTLQLHGRGVFLCISPWNFPCAIFMGQVSAALAAGNAVIAKPAEQTPLIAAEAVRILHEAGIPPNVLHLLPGPGETVGASLVRDLRIAGIAFTGSTETARLIAKTLAERGGPIVPFIAETGGVNAMLVDSSALSEQVTGDVLLSAFGSAGQRCSALRLLILQERIADRMLEMVSGAMMELRIGNPTKLATDIGPVIDRSAQAMLKAHAEKMRQEARLLAQVPYTDECEHGCFFTPHLFEIKQVSALQKEVFGPILHVARYREQDLDAVIDAVNGTGYGLTFGIHSRIDQKIDYLAHRIRAGNIYVNRSMIGAVVGVQPFGGEGLSGTGPKAGGPYYLPRFATERTVSINTTAAGGNATLLAMS